MQTKTDDSLSQFKLFKRFHLFYYSRKDGQTHFLLRQKKEGFFSAIKGRLETHDPAILFSVGRKIMEMSSGLLTQQNMELFAENSAYTIVNKDMIQFCRPRQQMPQLLNSKLFQRFIEEMFETSQIYQDSHSEDAYYFVEVPYMDLEKFHEFCLTNSICPNLSLKYFSLEEILSDTLSLKIYKSFKDLFTPSLVSHIEKYIINSEPIPIKARYAVVCILTTPTNYRTMGLLGSYYKKFGEQWKFYRFPLEEPTELDLKDLDGLLIPGATVCAADKSLTWRDKLLKLIKTVYEDYPSCKILGSCFGLQIISEALDGKCERMKEPIRGSSKLNISQEFWELPYMKGIRTEIKNDLLVPKSHFDAVTKAPKGATIYASSENCPVEIMGIGERVLAFQGHPEINESWTACLIYQTLNEKMNFNVYYEEIKKKYFQEKLEHELWLKIVNNFFKQKVLL